MLSIAEAMWLQESLSDKVIAQDDFSHPVQWIAGADVAYDKDSDLLAGAVVVLDRNTRKIVEVATHIMEATFPYVSGLFSFREMPPVVAAFYKLSQRPHVVICDGQGRAHPRKFGFACHLGLELNIPTIGCGKTWLYGNYEPPRMEKGSCSFLYDEKDKEIIGKAVRTQDGINPVFVSVGHKISLRTACAVVLKMCDQYRLPETTRWADRYAREALLQA